MQPKRDLTNQGIVITGASQGLGATIARACFANGASLVLSARNETLLTALQQELLSGAFPDQQVSIFPADISDKGAAEELSAFAARRLPKIHGLVNNAGINGPKGLLEDTDPEEWIHTLQVNLIGPMLLCRSLLPLFRTQGSGKIVNLSGGGATAPMPRFSAYAASKAAIVRFTETIAEETKGTGIAVNAIAPGALATQMLEEVLAAGPDKIGASYYQKMLKLKHEGGAPIHNAADLCVFLLSAKSNGITGRLISAVWDPWQTFPERVEQIGSSDVYTLRRIVPKDRNLEWE